ncbi:Hypothetical predicted protein [Octopus vulgaris]|uniref:Uncharacterized protein n=2 Tax=Octopus TaxID=6643 RepID=A0AA36F322_OCTVU|nr:uncharacterized protein LOC115211048 [Octopus sinensis]XP_036358393.1 uncharacterized protein LOC115211048 [Octopus sinensis]CAI9720833.1 Hypothetical predicted protein [Octopus vulgaris]
MESSQMSTDKTISSNGETPRVLFKRLYERAAQLGIDGHHLSTLSCITDIRPKTKKQIEEEEERIANGGLVWSRTTRYFMYAILLLLASIFCVFFLNVPVSGEQVTNWWFSFNDYNLYNERCLIDVHESISLLFRPPADCKFCRNVTHVDRVSGISVAEFEKDYAYSGRPVIITDGMKNWTALDVFSFEFFKGIYSEDSPALSSSERNCQFFPYQTKFKNLGEVFQMDPARVDLTDSSNPWYIGWSNCDIVAGGILRQHYSKPYFLPEVSESSRTDWIFMGTPGYGAEMHVDNVGDPSWQAQVTGHKKWQLEPPPECYYECVASLDVVVNPGEIIVLDTNIWFHSTKNVGSDLSITIGSEYD